VAFVELLDWAYHTPNRLLDGISTEELDLNCEDDFNSLESVQVTLRDGDWKVLIPERVDRQTNTEYCVVDWNGNSESNPSERKLNPQDDDNDNDDDDSYDEDYQIEGTGCNTIACSGHVGIGLRIVPMFNR
jgi:hypothetical protein